MDQSASETEKRDAAILDHSWPGFLPGADHSASAVIRIGSKEGAEKSNAITLAKLKLIRRLTGADYALGDVAPDAQVEFEPAWFTAADMETRHAPGETLVATMTGEQLVMLHATLTDKKRVIVWPDLTVARIKPAIRYRVVMEPGYTWTICRGAGVSLPGTIEVGPRWRQADLTNAMFAGSTELAPRSAGASPLQRLVSDRTLDVHPHGRAVALE